MKIKIDNDVIYELSETMKNIIKNDIEGEIFEEDMKRRVHWVLSHKYEQCMKRLRNEWEQKLKDRYESLPSADEALAELIFSQPDYKNKTKRNIKQSSES